MSKLKEHGSGDAPRLALSMQIGRYRITPTLPGKVWITDTDSGEGGSFDERALETAVSDFMFREF
jgi:hypothetical protein